MYYTEIGEKPVFETTEVYVRLTNGQTEAIKQTGAGTIDGVNFYSYQWNNEGGTIEFLAPKLTEILTVIKGFDIAGLPEWEQRAFKGNRTRTIKALEEAVSKKWANEQNRYEGQIKRCREFAESVIPTYTPVLNKGQYGFVWKAERDGHLEYAGSVTVAPVPFISLDGTPTIEWVCDNDGFYLTMGGDDSRRSKATDRYGTLETALERGKAMLETYIADTLETERKWREEAVETLAKLDNIA